MTAILMLRQILVIVDVQLTVDANEFFHSFRQLLSAAPLKRQLFVPAPAALAAYPSTPVGGLIEASMHLHPGLDSRELVFVDSGPRTVRVALLAGSTSRAPRGSIRPPAPPPTPASPLRAARSNSARRRAWLLVVEDAVPRPAAAAPDAADR